MLTHRLKTDLIFNGFSGPLLYRTANGEEPIEDRESVIYSVNLIDQNSIEIRYKLNQSNDYLNHGINSEIVNYIKNVFLVDVSELYVENKKFAAKVKPYYEFTQRDMEILSNFTSERGYTLTWRYSQHNNEMSLSFCRSLD